MITAVSQPMRPSPSIHGPTASVGQHSCRAGLPDDSLPERQAACHPMADIAAETIQDFTAFDVIIPGLSAGHPQRMGLTFWVIFTRFPSSSMMKVDLMPIYFLPYMLFFLEHVVKVHHFLFPSERRGKFSSFLSRKLQCFLTESRLTPTTAYPRAFEVRWSRALASRVAPEVLSLDRNRESPSVL